MEPDRADALRFWEGRGWQRAVEAEQPHTRVLMVKEIASAAEPERRGVGS
ncbi:hypothetical protein [Streptomyces sp. NPDC055287]